MSLGGFSAGNVVDVLVLILVALIVIAAAVVAFTLLSLLLVPLILGGIAALALGALVGWSRVEFRSGGESYTLIIRVERPLEFLLLWLILAVAAAVLLYHH